MKSHVSLMQEGKTQGIWKDLQNTGHRLWESLLLRPFPFHVHIPLLQDTWFDPLIQWVLVDIQAQSWYIQFDHTLIWPCVNVWSFSWTNWKEHRKNHLWNREYTEYESQICEDTLDWHRTSVRLYSAQYSDNSKLSLSGMFHMTSELS